MKQLGQRAVLIMVALWSLMMIGGCDDAKPGAATEPDGSAGSSAGGGSGGSGGTGGSGGVGLDSGSAGIDGSVAGTDGGGAAIDGGVPATLSAQYVGDQGIESDSRVLFHSDFENGMAGWTRFTQNTDQIDVLTDATTAHAGSNYLRAQVTRTMLASDQYISANAQVDLPRRVPEMYWRFYARVVGTSAQPHHWVRVAAGTPSFNSDGLANTQPAGDQGFWYDLDLSREDLLRFYVYWHAMRSGRCNDGSATPGCAGDQGNTYYYGNNFTPAGQTALPRDAWVCIELRTKANTVGTTDGELAVWRDDVLVGEYVPGAPRGRWLRDNFYTWGQYYQDDQAFEGFDFRTDADVLLKRVTLDAYYERGTLPTTAPEAQVILYDDVVVATTRIGCRVQ